jgi:hypothetical protein
MSSTAISLGWDCGPAMHGVSHGLRATKEQGYNTCPFDLMNSNYQGVIECIRDDFKYFCDPKYLRLINIPENYFKILGYHAGAKLIVNTKYKFIFNHESPNHGDLHLHENWKNGAYTYCDDNFKEFIIRYQNRINNFREYVNSGIHIHFIIAKVANYFDNQTLIQAITEKYPQCKFSICELIESESDRITIFHECMEFMNTQFYGNLIE